MSLRGVITPASLGVMTPTKFKWHRIESGVYEREDGAFRVQRAWRNEVCGDPHPGCPGEQLHEKPCWQIVERTVVGGWHYIIWENDTWATKREAVELVGTR